ncbi:MAG: DUF5305 family protein [Thermoplasmata archaeon]
MKAVVIGLVVFVCLAAFAGYWVAETDHPATIKPTPVFTYTQSGKFGYIADLKNNTLYNTTHLTPGNGTLFTAITSWVNFSFTFRLTANHAINATSVASISVLIQTPDWSKTIATESARTTVHNGATLILGATYNLNVANVTSIASSIEKQTGYTPSSYSVIIEPNVHSSAQLGESATGISFVPSLSLNFTQSQITPSRLSFSSNGAFFLPGDPPTLGKANVSVVAFLLLFGALGGAGAMAYLTYDSRHDEQPALELAAVTRPYEEAIVDARAPPASTNLVPVRAWEDIVKAADTLGAPILRVARTSMAGPNDPAYTSFYVVSGSTAFVFVHGGRSGGASPADVPVKSSTTTPARPLTSAVRDWHERYPRIPGVDTTSLDSFVQWTDRISDRLRWFRPSSSLRQDSEELLLRAIGLAQRGRIDAAWVVLGQLYSRLGPWDVPDKKAAASDTSKSPPSPASRPPATKGSGPAQ